MFMEYLLFCFDGRCTKFLLCCRRGRDHRCCLDCVCIFLFIIIIIMISMFMFMMFSYYSNPYFFLTKNYSDSSTAPTDTLPYIIKKSLKFAYT